jgi:hypothetical protein
VSTPQLNIVFRGTYALKTTLEQVLRSVFSDINIVPTTYLYAAKEADSKIKIYRSHPGRVLFYPSIIISAGPHDPDIQSFPMSREIASENYDGNILTSQTATGYVSMPINLKIFTKKADDRDILADLLVSIVRITGRDKSHQLWWNRVHRAGDSQEIDVTDHTITYTETITLTMHTDYTAVFSESQLGLISKIMDQVTPVVNFTP